ncbi:MAG: biotin--[acetyl-CoA-carboxylase] ligase [Rickettsiales bacterium]|jgi:BirA family biotin operon repressor/biotin-[acetyl-CoA-carboxylase] ligase|nr:biotin--[acetyl-CoA-carboxylase] ligase [Rickettsiales bacterium]
MFKIYSFKEVSSTMDAVKSFPVNTILVAKSQTDGRGKQNSVWVSDESENLYMSISMNPNSVPGNYSNFVFLISLVVVKTLKGLIKTDFDIKIKWPNDILVNGRKVCGILLELDKQKNSLIIGVGLNIDKHPEFLKNSKFKATDLKSEGFLVTRDAVVREFERTLTLYMARIFYVGFYMVREEWLKYAYNLGKTITVKINDSTEITGIFEGLDTTGELILNKDGERFYIDTGDVF